MLRAGVIPYAYNQANELVLLYGKETHNQKWAPFVGKVENNETIKQAAIREFIEESMGFFNEIDVSKRLSLLSSISLGSTYLYLLKVDYDEKLPYYFANVLKHLRSCVTEINLWGTPVIPTCPKGYFEKSAIEWFRFDDLVSYGLRSNSFDEENKQIIRLLQEVTWANLD